MRTQIKPNYSDRNKLFLFLSASLILLYFIFSPGTHILYYAGDDFRYAVGADKRLCKQDDGFFFMKTVGRPLQAYLDCAVYKYTRTINDMIFLRIISVALLAIGMGLLANWLYTLGFSFWLAFFTSGSLFLIQKLYSDTVLIGALSLPLTILLVILGYICMNKAHQLQWNDIETRRKKIKWHIYAIILFTLSLLTYPALAFFFGTLVLLKLLFSNINQWTKTRNEVLQEVILFSVLCVIYFAWASYNMRYHSEAPVPPQYQMKLNSNLSELITRAKPLANVFTGGPWVQLFPFDFPFGGQLMQGWLTILILTGGLVIATNRFFKSNFYLEHKINALRVVGEIIFFVICMLLYCSAFYLIIPNRENIESRLVFSSVTSGFPLLFWAVFRWGDLLSKHLRIAAISGFMGLFFIVEGYQANIKIMYDAMYFAQKLSIVETQIKEYLDGGNKLRRIHYIIPEPDYPYNKYFLSNAALVQLKGQGFFQANWCSLPRGVPGAEKDHQKEMNHCIHQLSENGVAITYSRPGEPIFGTKNMLMIKTDVEKQKAILNNLVA